MVGKNYPVDSSMTEENSLPGQFGIVAIVWGRAPICFESGAWKIWVEAIRDLQLSPGLARCLRYGLEPRDRVADVWMRLCGIERRNL